MCIIMALIRCKDIENCWRVYVLSTHCYSSIFRRLGIKACLVMTPLLGITWLFGLLTPLHKAFIYIFTILNSTQVNYLCLFNSSIAFAHLRAFANGLPIWTLFSKKSTFPTHFKVRFCLCVKTSLRAKSFIWKCVPPTGSFSCKSNLCPCKRFCTSTRFETGAQGNSKMAFYNYV